MAQENLYEIQLIYHPSNGKKFIGGGLDVTESLTLSHESVEEIADLLKKSMKIFESFSYCSELAVLETVFKPNIVTHSLLQVTNLGRDLYSEIVDVYEHMYCSDTCCKPIEMAISAFSKKSNLKSLATTIHRIINEEV